MLLPTNALMLEELSKLSTHPTATNGTANGAEVASVRWGDILDPTSTFKLLYSLQIVDSLLLPNMTYVSLSYILLLPSYLFPFSSLGAR